MKYTLKIYSALCATEIFKINGMDADKADFGEQSDNDRENAQEYGCGNMEFTPKPPTNRALDKYKITADEYNIIAAELATKLSFGSCGWCV
jgi:hypothetical protein